MINIKKTKFTWEDERKMKQKITKSFSTDPAVVRVLDDLEKRIQLSRSQIITLAVKYLKEELENGEVKIIKEHTKLIHNNKEGGE